MIPMMMRLSIRRPAAEGGSRINLWIPLILAWLLLLPVFVLAILAWAILRILSPATLRIARILEAAGGVLWKIDGLRIDVRSRESRFILHF